MLNESIIKNVNQIPPLPESILKIEEFFAKGSGDIKELVKIIEADPILTADILALVNSPLYAFSKNIVSMQQAITLFGMGNIRGFILSTISKNSFDMDMSPYGITNKKFQEISLLQSTLMFQWYMTINIQQSGILVPIAFMMDLGKIIIAKVVIDKGLQEEFSKEIQESDSIAEVEKKYTGYSSAEVTALLFKHWNFNETFEGVVKHSDDPYYSDEEYQVMSQAVDVVKTCINVKGIMNEKNMKASKLKALGYGLAIANFIKTAERIQAKIENM